MSMNEGFISAAEYCRASTDQQENSIGNQQRAIAIFAKKNGMKIVESFVDSGVSGLASNRPGLNSLLNAVQQKDCQFETVIVYDVSRLGRFQDPDEGAFIERTIKRAGCKILYCAEEFDGLEGLTGSVMKAIKRVMAGQYSKDLSERVFEGQAALVRRGFRLGGISGYGLRRLLIDKDGSPKAVLQFGERKSLTTDRVILVAGPDEETAVVREIFDRFAEGVSAPGEIADILNRRGVSAEAGRKWTREKIRQMLGNRKYVGDNVWNKTSTKLKSKMSKNQRDSWVTYESAFCRIIGKDIFEKVQIVLGDRSRKRQRSKLDDLLRDCLARNGRLSINIINRDSLAPNGSTVIRHYGSMYEAYRTIGYNGYRNISPREASAKTQRFIGMAYSELECMLRDAAINYKISVRESVIEMENGFRIRISVLRHFNGIRVGEGWDIRLFRNAIWNRLIVARLCECGANICQLHWIGEVSGNIKYLRLRRDDLQGWAKAISARSINDILGVVRATR